LVFVAPEDGMKLDIFGAILTKLNGDATLQGLLGGTNRCFRARRILPEDCSCVTVKSTNESSSPRVGYAVYQKIRDQSALIQVDIWVSAQDETKPCTGEDTDEIETRIDAILLDAVTETSGTLQGSWQKTTASQQFEDDVRIWHNAIRYGFQYSLTDT
jgi:hypothetical protein